jgi:hypothetical protein
MSNVDGDEGFLVDPETIIAAAVAAVEPQLGDAIIQAAINKAAPTPTKRRRLAIALTDAPELLTSGHPQGPPQIESLISALRRAGARRVTPPRCGDCGRVVHLSQRDGGRRICARCDRRGRSEPCAGCGAIAPRSPPAMRTACRAARIAAPRTSRTPTGGSPPTSQVSTQAWTRPRCTS